MSDHLVEEILPPVSVDVPEAADFLAAVDVKNALELEGYGTDELSYTAAESLPGWHDETQPIRLFVVRADGRIVARVFFSTLRDDVTGTAWLGGGVLPDYRNRGIGSALLSHVESIAREAGLKRLILYVVSADGPGDRLVPPTGFGSVPRDNAEVRFLVARGFALEQVERASRLALPARVSFTVPAGYRVHTWVGRTPENWLADVAHLLTRMSTDAPSAGLEEPEDVWTADRLRENQERFEASPRTELFAVVEHEASGRLVGFSVLSAPAELDRPVGQEDTLVLAEHRGHRLGMLLKTANIEHLQRARPGHPAIITFNAEENRHMLDVNEAVGFVPIGYEGAWKKEL
ncbi:GNAT family N-acetyltransferase [Glaciihabitans arcticus]|nr:GNAT family N-acetyltransferase [Glaciihabitans arcticus]